MAAISLVTLILLDVSATGFHDWWNRHSLTGSVVANLLVLAVAALAVDEVVARRLRREHSVSVAVQAAIVYRQARRAYDAFTAIEPEGIRPEEAYGEMRTMASMLLTASPSLYNDRATRAFLEHMERFLVLMFRAVPASAGGELSSENRARLASEISGLHSAVQPLRIRLPSADRSLLDVSADP